MGKNNDPPPAPDYSGIAQASAAGAKLAYRASQDQLAWAKKQYAMDSKITKQVVDAALKRQYELDSIARQDRERYEKVFQPLEDQLVAEAAGYTDERNAARAEAAAGRATADVSQQYELARASAQDRLESFGIDPSQTRAGALDISARIAEATARAGAANVTREQTRRAEEATGRALRSEALNIGRGMPGQVVNAYGAALQQGTGAAGVQGQGTQVGAGTMGTGAQWMGAGTGALNTWGNTLNMGYNNQLNAWKADQSQSSGWGQALGMIGGLGATALMPGAQQWAYEKVWGFDDGGVVPPEASPSQGVDIDDVNVHVRDRAGNKVAAGAINVGEFIVPTDVVSWKGEEFFQKLIAKSRENKQQAPAKPDVRGGPALPVTPRGNPARQALPLGQVA